MTIEEIFSDLYDKYGEDFNWYMLPLSLTYNTSSLDSHFATAQILLSYKKWSSPISFFNSVTNIPSACDNGRNADIYYIFHLTYSKHNSDGFPRYEEIIVIN